jgi:hypothetical protein
MCVGGKECRHVCAHGLSYLSFSNCSGA